MAAIVPFIETPAVEPPPNAVALAALADAGDRTAYVKEILQQSHAGLTRFYWNRLLLEEHLRTCRVWLERDGSNDIVFRIDRPIPRDVRPWKRISPTANVDRFNLFGADNQKMACPTWDLPSGPPNTGGTCPGALAAQTTVPVDARRAHLTRSGTHLKAIPPGAEEPVPYKEAQSICVMCYAAEGSYDYGEIQAGEVIRYWWTNAMLKSEGGYREWVRIVAAGLLARSIPTYVDEPDDLGSNKVPPELRTGRTLRPVRLHSSGDFFSKRYAEAWVDVCNVVGKADPSIVIWAPTRTWAAPGWQEMWPDVLRRLRRPNLVLRPSAFHIGDRAPDGLVEIGRPGYSRGTTSLVGPGNEQGGGTYQAAFPEAIARPIASGDDRRDWDCPVYSLHADGDLGSCAVARCRICWLRPDLRVNYTLH